MLVFSDIHGDSKALKNLMSIEAEASFAAGDLMNWGRGLDQIRPILAPRASRMYVLPGSYESAADIEQFCQNFGFHNFHGGIRSANAYQVAGLGYSNPTPSDTPGAPAHRSSS